MTNTGFQPTFPFSLDKMYYFNILLREQSKTKMMKFYNEFIWNKLFQDMPWY